MLFTNITRTRCASSSLLFRAAAWPLLASRALKLRGKYSSSGVFSTFSAVAEILAVYNARCMECCVACGVPAASILAIAAFLTVSHSSDWRAWPIKPATIISESHGVVDRTGLLSGPVGHCAVAK